MKAIKDILCAQMDMEAYDICFSDSYWETNSEQKWKEKNNV